MKTLESFLGELIESVFARREEGMQSEFKATILTGDQYQLRNLIGSRLRLMWFGPQLNKAGKKKGTFFPGLDKEKINTDPTLSRVKGAASYNRMAPPSLIKDTLIKIVGKKGFEVMNIDQQVQTLNDMLDATKSYDSKEGQALINKITNLVTKTLTKRPTKLLGTNLKIKHSNIGTIKMFKIGLPAFHSIFLDEDDNQWKLLRTCPDAKDCIGLCFAANGQFVATYNHAVSGTRLVNFLMNDPDGFANQLASEISDAAGKLEEGQKLYVRIHDSGDLISEYYFDLINMVCKKLPNVTFFAYTKSLKLLAKMQKEGRVPPNFILNRSEGSKDSSVEKYGEETKGTEFFDRTKLKHSTIIRKEYFRVDPDLQKIKGGTTPTYDYMMKDTVIPGIPKKGIEAKTITSKEKWELLKNFIAKRYKRPVEKILSAGEFMEKINSLDEKNPVDVIVFPSRGDSDHVNNDISATTHGVLGTYLIEH